MVPHVDDLNNAVLLGLALEEAEGTEWRSGLPPGGYYPSMENDYEVVYAPAGAIWHRLKANPQPNVES